MEIDESKIPKGDYCYTIVGEGLSLEINGEKKPYQKIKRCPYWKAKDFGGVLEPYCEVLKQGSIHPDTTEEEEKKLLDFFGSEKEMEKIFPSGRICLLWEGIKECGINPEDEEKYDFGEEE